MLWNNDEAFVETKKFNFYLRKPLIYNLMIEVRLKGFLRLTPVHVCRNLSALVHTCLCLLTPVKSCSHLFMFVQTCSHLSTPIQHHGGSRVQPPDYSCVEYQWRRSSSQAGTQSASTGLHTDDLEHAECRVRFEPSTKTNVDKMWSCVKECRNIEVLSLIFVLFSCSLQQSDKYSTVLVLSCTIFQINQFQTILVWSKVHKSMGCSMESLIEHVEVVLRISHSASHTLNV